MRRHAPSRRSKHRLTSSDVRGAACRADEWVTRASSCCLLDGRTAPIRLDELARPCAQGVQRPTELAVFRRTGHGQHPDVDALFDWLAGELADFPNA